MAKLVVYLSGGVKQHLGRRGYLTWPNMTVAVQSKLGNFEVLRSLQCPFFHTHLRSITSRLRSRYTCVKYGNEAERLWSLDAEKVVSDILFNNRAFHSLHKKGALG